MVKAAFIGTGWWGRELAQAAVRLGSLTIAGCCALTQAERERFQAEFGGEIFPDLDAALASASVDAVVLATPHTLHADQIRRAAAAGKHVFVEKPLTLDAASARGAVAACAEAGVVLAVGHNRRYSKGAVAMRDLVQSGACGQILHVEANFSGNSALNYAPGQWRALRSEAPAAPVASMALHMVDTLTWILEPIARLTSITRRQVLSVDLDDTTATLFELESGVTGLLGSLFASPFTADLRIYGTKARLEARNDFKEWSILWADLERAPEQHGFDGDDTLVIELAAFVEACLGRQDYPLRPVEAVRNVAVLEAIDRSGREGGTWITLERD